MLPEIGCQSLFNRKLHRLCHLTVNLALNADNAKARDESDIGVGGDGVHGGELDVLAGAGSGGHGLVVLGLAAVQETETKVEATGLVGLAHDNRESREGLERKGRVGGWAGLDESGGQGVDGSRVEGLERSCQSGGRVGSNRLSLTVP